MTSVDQVFYNAYGRAVEGVYIFPLPQGATVSEFAMWIEGKRVKGELLDREEAAKIYHDIVRRLKDPALLELAKYNLFKASLFPIPARGEKRIELRYTEALQAGSGMLNYNYPLKGRGKTYLKPIESFSLAMRIASRIPITSVYSPTHKVEVTRKEDGAATVGFESKNFVPESDFQLYYTLSEKEFGLSLATFKEAGVDKGYLMMLIAPRTGLEREQVAAKDVVFVLDTSGSMQEDAKIEQAVRALKFGIRSLGSSDRFGLITFATEIRTFREGLISAGKENVDAALSFLDGVSATGATNIYDAMRTALGFVKESGRPRYIVFLTDGLPTHVERDPAIIIKKTGEWAPSGVRIFSWGVGFDVDTHLLDSISGNHGGVSEYVKPREEMELKLGQFFEKITFPVLTDLELKASGIQIEELYPRKLPDLFKGSQLVLFGRYSGVGSGKIDLSGKVGDRRQSFSYTVDIRETEGGEFIAHLWATRKVGFLLDEIRLHGENEELKQEVVRLAKKYGLVTPYTSYLVTEPGADQPRPIEARPQTVRDQRDRKADEEQDALASLPYLRSGREAIRYSTGLKEMKSEEKAGMDAGLPVRRVAGKTFNFKDGVWTDSEFSEDMRIVDVILNSDAYFELLQKDKRMAEWLSLGEKIVIAFDGVAYRIKPEN